jgi:hypothetical protein
MSESGDSSKDELGPPRKPTVILLLTDIADTTWRMFVPPIGGTLLGLYADSTWHTTPWLSIIGLALGIALTVVLMKQQFNKLKNS